MSYAEGLKSFSGLAKHVLRDFAPGVFGTMDADSFFECVYFRLFKSLPLTFLNARDARDARD